MLLSIINRLKDNGLKYSLEGYISGVYYYVREIFVYNFADKDRVRKILDKETLKRVKVKDTYVWYLGDRKEAVAIQMRKDVELSVPEFEAMQTNNYAHGS